MVRESDAYFKSEFFVPNLSYSLGLKDWGANNRKEYLMKIKTFLLGSVMGLCLPVATALASPLFSENVAIDTGTALCDVGDMISIGCAGEDAIGGLVVNVGKIESIPNGGCTVTLAAVADNVSAIKEEATTPIGLCDGLDAAWAKMPLMLEDDILDFAGEQMVVAALDFYVSNSALNRDMTFLDEGDGQHFRGFGAGSFAQSDIGS